MLDIKDFHGQDAPKEELDSVVIVAEGSSVLGTVNLPDGYTVTDFEYIEFASCTDGGSIIWDTERLTKGAYLAGLTDLRLSRAANNLGLNYELAIQSITDTSFDVVVPAVAITTTRLYYAIGYKKRYVTKNLSRTISVNSGNDITVNSRYEVDLPSEFYESDGSIKKGVQVRAEIYNDGSAGGEIGWGRAPIDMRFNSSTSGYFSGGVDAEILEDKVVVFSGENALAWQNTNRPTVFNNTSNISAAPCQVVATLNDAYILSVEPAQGSFERIVNAGLDVLEFTNNGDYAYVPLSDADFDGDIFEYNSTTRFLRPKKSGKHIPSVFSHAEDGAGQARVKYVLVQADTAQGDNPVVVTGVFTKQYTSDGGTQSIHTPVNLDESKWYALYAENFTSGNVTYTSLVSPTSDPDLGDITDYAFIFSLERG